MKHTHKNTQALTYILLARYFSQQLWGLSNLSQDTIVACSGSLSPQHSLFQPNCQHLAMGELETSPKTLYREIFFSMNTMKYCQAGSSAWCVCVLGVGTVEWGAS